ncbi:MAG TPA: hypothetical protein DCG57_19335, partial [Candidatus Riflebacteria bacterium]|nr:hypothetical protein [Candidatus Riflebacteria bacterium]
MFLLYKLAASEDLRKLSASPSRTPKHYQNLMQIIDMTYSYTQFWHDCHHGKHLNSHQRKTL